MANKQSSILNLDVAADQVSIAAVAMPGFVLDVARLAQSGTEPTSAGPRPLLETVPDDKTWLVTRADGSVLSATLWQLLRDPAVFGG